MGIEVSSEGQVRKRGSLPSEGAEDPQMSSEGTMGRIHQRRGVAGRTVRSSPSEEDPRQRGLDHGGGRDGGRGAPERSSTVGPGGAQETARHPPPQPRFNLLISLINHSPSSYTPQRIWFLPSSGSRGLAGKSPLLRPHNRLDKSLASGMTLAGLCCQQPLPLTRLSFPLLPQTYIWGLPKPTVQPHL